MKQFRILTALLVSLCALLLFFASGESEDEPTLPANEDVTESLLLSHKTHTPVEKIEPATAKKDGKLTKVCSVCGAVLKEKTIHKASDIRLSSETVFYNGKNRTPSVIVKTCEGKKLLSSYYTVSRPNEMRQPGKYTVTVTLTGHFKGTVKLSFRIKTPIPAKPTIETDTGMATVKWSRVKDADGYRLYISESKNGEYRRAASVKGNTATVKKLTTGKKYYFKVKAYIITADGKKHLSDFSPVSSATVKRAVKLTLGKSSMKLNVGTGITLKADAYPKKAQVQWKSSDKTVASVSSKGKVSAKSKGSCVITASFIYKEKKYEAKCAVTVKGSYACDMNGEKYAVIDPTATGEKWCLVVVDRSRRVRESYMPDIVSILPSLGCEQELDRRVAPYYEKMYAAAKKDGVTLYPYSAFRYYSGQRRNYLERIALWQSYGYSRGEAIEKTVCVIMAPGGSEHNLGLAVDINGTDYDFDNTAAYRWLSENACKYGFIQRYPEGKSAVTGVVCEPWHWRFVGVDAATEMRGSGLCLEEYLDLKGIAY